MTSKDIETNKNLYDTSDYPKDHPLHSIDNKKVSGKRKDECALTSIAECVCLRPKIYSVMKADEKKCQESEGYKKSVVKKQIMHKDYKETLFGEKKLWHQMNILRSEGHEIYGMCVNKISLSPFDSKRWRVEDGIHTNAYGYAPELRELELLAADEALKFLLGGNSVFGGITRSSSRTKPRLGPSRK